METRSVFSVTVQADAETQLNIPSIQAFFVLQLTGAAGFLLLVCTLLASPRLTRNSAWYSFCISWIISCLSYCFLLFIGQPFDPTPNYGLCAISAALIYAAPTLTGLTTCTLSMQMLDSFEAVRASKSPTSATKRVLMIVIPYLVWLGFFFAMLVYSLLSTDRVLRPGNYCESVSPIPPKLAALIVFLTMIRTIMIQVYIGRQLLFFRKSGDLVGVKPYIAMSFRMLIFGLVATLCVIIAFVFVITRTRDLTYDFILAIVPLSALFIFASQSDIIQTWIPCRRKRSQI